MNADAPSESGLSSASRKRLAVIAFAGLTGLGVGAVGAAFRTLLEALAAHRVSFFGMLSTIPFLGWLGPMLVVGVALLAAAELARRFAPETGGSGIQEIEGALGGLRPVRWLRVLPVKFLGGVLALGSGAVLGREGPTVHMGGAVGSMVGDGFRLPEDERHALLAAGAAAGLSAAFNAPLSGILFVVEEMRRRFRYSFASMDAVLLAAATADLVVRVITGPAPVIPMPVFAEGDLGMLWIFPLFGAFFGGFGVAFNRLLLASLARIDRLRVPARRLAPLAIGLVLGALLHLLPDAAGGGYRAIADALAGRLAGSLLLILFVVRFVATVGSYSAGAPGGIFAPMMALGTLFGMWFGTSLGSLTPGVLPQPGAFAVAGMAAFFAATVRAPLTGLALAVELTGEFGLILPLIFTCAGATLVARLLGGRPIYALLLERTLRQAGED
jgi:CIC family chloride channel protein